MTGLQKRDTALRLEIYGEEFLLHPYSLEFTEKRIALAQVAEENQKNLFSGGNNAEVIKGAIVALGVAVDALLGDGSIKRIFKEESLDLILMIDVVSYVFNALDAFDSEMGNALNPALPAAKKKAK